MSINLRNQMGPNSVKAERFENPFPHVVIDSILPEGQYTKLTMNLPKIWEYTPANEEGTPKGSKLIHFADRTNNPLLGEVVKVLKEVPSIYAYCHLVDVDPNDVKGVQILLVHERADYEIRNHALFPSNLAYFQLNLPLTDQYANYSTNLSVLGMDKVIKPIQFLHNRFFGWKVNQSNVYSVKPIRDYDACRDYLAIILSKTRTQSMYDTL